MPNGFLTHFFAVFALALALGASACEWTGAIVSSSGSTQAGEPPDAASPETALPDTAWPDTASPDTASPLNTAPPRVCETLDFDIDGGGQPIVPGQVLSDTYGTDGIEIRARGVERCGESGRAGSDDDDVSHACTFLAGENDAEL